MDSKFIVSLEVLRVEGSGRYLQGTWPDEFDPPSTSPRKYVSSNDCDSLLQPATDCVGVCCIFERRNLSLSELEERRELIAGRQDGLWWIEKLPTIKGRAFF